MAEAVHIPDIHIWKQTSAQLLASLPATETMLRPTSSAVQPTSLSA
ncbi:hypothetical protein WKU26_10190 [Phocaeicola sp. HCN-40430]